LVLGDRRHVGLGVRRIVLGLLSWLVPGS
jgi:hypothetical protein